MMRTFCLLAVAMLLQSPLRAQAQKRNLTQFLEETVSAERCAPADKRAGMIKAVGVRFADRALAVVDGPALPAAQAVAEVVTAACMRSLAPTRAAGLALAAYGAIVRGAHPGVVRAIASYGLDKDVSEERIRAWADGYAQMTAGRVPAETASEAVRNALDHGWSDKTFNEVKWGLVHAAKSGFDLKDFSSFVFARMLKDKTRPGAALAEAQAAFAKAKADGKKPAVPAYQGLFIPFVQETPTTEVADDAVKAGRPKEPVKPVFRPNQGYSHLAEGEKLNMEGQQGPAGISATDVTVEAGRPKGPAKPAAGPRAEVRDKSGGCVPTRIEVRADSPKASATPLKDALASAQDACKVEITLHVGEYPGDLGITADTTIRGRSGAAPVIKGRIENLSGKFLLLEDVTIASVKAKGLEQSGGKLFMKDVQVKGIQATSDITAGRGVIIRGGAQALLVNVTLEGNAGGGLLAKDEGTVVHAVGLTVKDNRVLPAVTERYGSSQQPELLGAVEASSRATFFGEKLVVQANQGIGISIFDQARANIRDLVVSGTKQTISATANNAMHVPSFDGHNIFVSRDSQLELSKFKSTNAGGVGLFVNRSYIKCTDGGINWNPFGISIQEAPSGFTLDACFINVDFGDNEIAFSGTEQPVPESGKTAAAQCPGVPWVEAPAFP